MTIWFTSDQHFGHTNIIRYSGRPFRDVQHMNEELVQRFNARVQPEDETWHLGDFALDEKMVPKYLPRLNGKHRLIAGNHDACHPSHKKRIGACARYLSYGFDFIFQGGGPFDFGIPGRVWVSHMPSSDAEDPRYPEYRPNPKDYDVLLHGHVHERWKRRGNEINVGVDQWDYAPVSLDELRDYVK